MSDIVGEIRALDADLAARITVLRTDHHKQRLDLLMRLLAETRSVSEACRQLGISRARWYQVMDQMEPSDRVKLLAVVESTKPLVKSSPGPPVTVPAAEADRVIRFW